MTAKTIPLTQEAALEKVIDDIRKKYGPGAIMKMNERQLNIPVISTTCVSIDHALGVGGVPRGRIIEIFGPESSGKTTLALHIISQAQKLGDNVAFVDAEHAIDFGYAEKLGVNVDDMVVTQPDSGEQALEITEALVRSSAVGIIVVDSVAALVPKAEIDGEMGDSLPGLHARLMSQALRKLTAIVAQSNTCLIFINQIREKIGVMYGSPETTTGGRALKFYATMRIEIRRTGPIKDGDKIIGNRVKVKVVKNKVAPPTGECDLDILYGEGLSQIGDVLDVAVTRQIIDKSGAWYSYHGERLGQGRDNAKATLLASRKVLTQLEMEVRTALGLDLLAVNQMAPAVT